MKGIATVFREKSLTKCVYGFSVEIFIFALTFYLNRCKSLLATLLKLALESRDGRLGRFFIYNE